MKQATISAGLGLLVVAVLTPGAWGQAMIGYGINVSRAGAAGAAAGSGLGGALSRLGRQSEEASQAATRTRTGASSQAHLRDTMERTAAPNAIKLDLQRNKSFAHQKRLRTQSGVMVAGLPSAPQAHTSNGPARVWSLDPPPRQRRPATGGNKAEKPTEAGTEEKAEEKEVENENDATASTAPLPAQEKQPIESRVPAEAGILTPIISRAPVDDGASATASADQSIDLPAPVVPVSDSRIEIGGSVSDLISRWGHPYMALKGLSGNGYSERYIFRTPEGNKIVVLALAGVITEVAYPESADELRAELG